MISFDNAPTIYWFMGYLFAGLLILSAYGNKVSGKIHVFLGIALLVFMRLPVIVFNRELNPDESQMLSHALTLFQDPVYWRSVDGTTIGPLDNYLLVLPRIFGFQVDYSAGRVMGLLCAAGSMICLYYSLKNWFGEHSARRLWLVPLFLLAFTQELDFVHYSSEQVPVLLIAVSLLLLSRLGQSPDVSAATTYLIGLFTGASPFAKLQAVPQALVIVGAAAWYCWLAYQNRKNIRPFIALIAGGLTIPVFMLAFTLVFGVFGDMIDFYLLGNAVYAAGATFFEIPAQLVSIIRHSPDFQAFLAVLAVPFVLSLIAFRRIFQEKQHEVVKSVFFLLFLLSGVYAVTKSGNEFVHYLNFLIIPITLFAGLALTSRSWFSLGLPVLLILWFGLIDGYGYIRERRLNAFDSVNTRTLRQSDVVAALEKYALKNDFMVVWGWQCAYYVEAQLAQGTAENHSERCIFDHPMREVYRKRYMSDLMRNKPAIIVDAVGKSSLWVQDKKTQGIRSFPALYEYVHEHYSLVRNIDDTDLYIRKDRL